MAFNAPQSDLEQTGFVAPDADIEPIGFSAPESDLAFTAPESDVATTDQDDPTLGEVGTGLVAEIGIAEGAKYGGATAGAAIGSVVPGIGTAIGAGVGYATGAIGGGITGSIAAQKFEGRDDISWGRVAADTVLNLLPFGASKIKKGAKLLPRLAEGALKQGAAGAGLSVSGLQIEKGIEEGEFLTPGELMSAAGVGAGLGLGLGALGSALTRSYNKMFAKSPDEIDKLYRKGDVDANTYIDALTGGDPNDRTKRRLLGIQSYVVPSRVLGSRASEDIRRAINETEAAKDVATKALKLIDPVYEKIGKQNPGLRQRVDLYIDGKIDTLPAELSGLKSSIDAARALVTDSQNRILKLADQGFLKLDEDLVAKIRQSTADGSYLTREYRFYEDPNYKPSADAEVKLRDSMAKGDMSSSEIDDTIAQLYDSRGNPYKAVNKIAENVRVFKDRDKLSKELEEFLGVYERPGERFFGTINRLGRYAAEQTAASNISRSLRESGLAVTARNRPAGADYQQLRIKNTPIVIEGEALYVPKAVNDSINQLYGTRVPAETFNIAENAFTKLLSTTTGLSKFVKVPLAPAAYSPQLFGNMFMVIGQGMNPIRGFRKGLGVAGAELRGKGLSLQDFNRYKSLGLVDKDIRSGDIRNALERGYDIPMLKTGPGRIVKGASKKIGKAYSALDTAMRISVFENYKKQLKSMSPNIEVKMGKENFDKLAAELTNSTYQNYDRISPSLKFLSRVGVLNEFVSFNLEMLRTTANQGMFAKSLIDGSFAKRMKDEFGVKIDTDAAMREGAKRLTALSGALGAASAGIYFFNKANGFSDEEMEAIRNSVAYEWDDSSALIFDRDGDKIGLTNMAYRMPIADMTAILGAASRGEDATEVISNSFQAIGDKFFGQGTMNAKAIINAIQDRDPEGRKISKDPEFLGSVFDRIKYYGTTAFEPGFVRDIKNWDRRTPKEQAARYLLGERKVNITIPDGVGYRLRGIRDNIDALRVGYSGTMRKNNIDYAETYKSQNDIYRKNGEAILGHVKNLRILGKTDKEIEDILKKNINDSRMVKGVMRGVIPNMSIAYGISGTKLDRASKYADIYSKLPNELGLEMLRQEIDKKNINRSMLELVKRISVLRGQ